MIDRYLPMPFPLPMKLAGLFAAAAGIVDLNYGAIAGGLTVVGGSATLLYWNFASKRTEAMRLAEAAKVQAFRESEAAKLEIYRASEAAKLQVQRDAELARIGLQKEQDEANKGSLSAQLQMLSGQLTAIQRSADEANRSLLDAREMNKLLREQLDAAGERDALAAQRIEDANKKLHDLLNESNVKNLRHELEKRELQAAKDDLARQLDEIRRSTDKVSEVVVDQIVPKVADNSARIEDASTRLDKLDGGA